MCFVLPLERELALLLEDNASLLNAEEHAAR